MRISCVGSEVCAFSWRQWEVREGWQAVAWIRCAISTYELNVWPVNREKYTFITQGLIKNVLKLWVAVGLAHSNFSTRKIRMQTQYKVQECVDSILTNRRAEGLLQPVSPSGLTPMNPYLLLVARYIQGGIGIRRPVLDFREKEANIGIFWTLQHSETWWLSVCFPIVCISA